MENSQIEWTENTFNPWIGCTKVSPGCLHCYAEAQMDKWLGKVQWGKGNPRVRTSAAYWAKPVEWNRRAIAEGRRIRVFCASLADVFDEEVDDAWRDDLFALIRATPHLDWQLLTKRPEKALRYAKGIAWPPNAWMGTSVEDRARVPRSKIIAQIPARIHFLSVEPLLEEVELDLQHMEWVIVGGESGRGARPMNATWVRRIRDQCAAAGVPLYFKQWGGRNAKAAGRELDGRLHDEFPTIPVDAGHPEQAVLVDQPAHLVTGKTV